jgi:hypothetical protein
MPRIACTLAFAFAAVAQSQAQTLTVQYDNERTGATLHETVLTPANVAASHFGKVFSFAVDGDVYAQPLYVPGVEIPNKGKHDVVFIATEHDSVYAFDAEGKPAEPLWHVNFLNAAAGITTVSARDVDCPFIEPEIGITPTPAIDVATGTLYVLARTKQRGGTFSSARFAHSLHALAITTGSEKFGGPKDIDAPGFDGQRELPRAGLLLTGGQVYLTWGSSCDVAPYHGWVMAYDAHTLARTAALDTSPKSGWSGIWQSDNGPAADDQGNIYVATGNGLFNASTANGRDYGDSLLKLRLAGRNLDVADYFTPADQRRMEERDEDLGSGGPMLLPTGAPALALIGGKDGNLYVLDRNRLGKYRVGSDSQAVQVIHLRDGIYSAPAYWNGHVYIMSSGDYLSDYPIENGKLAEKPRALGGRFGNPGATPAISANGDSNGIVWLIETKGWRDADRPAILHAYNAANVERELYNSEQNGGRDQAGLACRFNIPLIANGRVYVPTKRRVDVYGLLSSGR